MDEKKRTTLAMVLTAIILIAWFAYMDRMKVEQEPEGPKDKKPAAEASQQAQAAKPVSTTPVPAPQVTAALPSTIVVKTPLYTATLSTLGAQITSFKLGRYLTTMDKDARPVEMLKAPMPALSLSKGATDAGVVYAAAEKGTVTVTDTPRAIEFTAQTSGGITLRKIYTVDPKTYLLGYQTVIENRGASPVAVSGEMLFPNLYPLDKKLEGYAFQGPVFLGKHLEEFDIKKVKKPLSHREFTDKIQWFGFEDKYFLQAVISKTAPDATLTVQRTDEKVVEMRYSLPPATIQPGTSVIRDNLIFIGPKEIHTLKATGYDLAKALDFGFFDIIAKPLLVSMNWIYKYTLSYGWTIIILTIIIKILLYPLTLKSFTSMKELQKIQPLMKEVQEQYKDDKQKMNQELMRLYQEHKINPLGGCLPMLLQIPILFALYRVFYSAIELRHTPFHIVGTWLPDLSEADPYFITPVLMGITQFILQKMTPTTGDPTQQKIMLIMPVVFTFMFIYFPSGLVIYWLVSNILSIVQQAYINRKHA